MNPGTSADASPTGREPELNVRNYRICADDRLGDGSLKQKCRDNLAAIELVRLLDSQSRVASDEEKRILVKYVGWGGIPQVFASPLSTEWQAEGQRLKVLLTSEEYEAARASTLNAHYTSAIVISAIYDAVGRIGFTHGQVLEPALGIGNFFGLMPAEMSARSRLTGVEIDPLTAKIARQLYPDADIRAQGFEIAALGDGSFDLAISNVPFGDYKLHDPSFNEHNFLVHDYWPSSPPREPSTRSIQACADISRTKSISSARYVCQTRHSTETRTPKSRPTLCSCANWSLAKCRAARPG